MRVCRRIDCCCFCRRSNTISIAQPDTAEQHGLANRSTAALDLTVEQDLVNSHSPLGTHLKPMSMHAHMYTRTHAHSRAHTEMLAYMHGRTHMHTCKHARTHARTCRRREAARGTAALAQKVPNSALSRLDSEHRLIRSRSSVLEVINQQSYQR